MRAVVVPHASESGGVRGGTIALIDDAGTPVSDARDCRDLAATVAEIESARSPRWVWTSTATVYPGLLRAGVRVQRCHDLATTAAILNTRDGIPPEPIEEPADERPGLFDAAPATDIAAVI